MMTINLKNVPVLTFIAVPLLLSPAVALQTKQEQAVLVGHITYLQGNMLRYVHDDENWVQLVKDSPVGPDDVLLCETNAQAEIIIPNNTWVRMGRNTRIQIINLENDKTEIDMDSGMARFYNKSTSATIKAITPFGSILAPPLTTFDAYLDKDAVQVTALAGTVHFNHITDNSSHEIREGLSSLRADYQTITAGDEMVDEDFNAWNAKRDSLWEERMEEQTETQNHLPQNLHYSSYALQENGIWETVYYQGRSCNFWRPTHVSSYWSPFTVGSWTVWYGDHCWIPYEPFGYVTHHYGNWIYMDSCNRWYWAPPVCHAGGRSIIVLDIPFAWYPGRVSWIYNDDCIGWIPLAPFEPYYCHRSWGPHTYVVSIDRLRRVKVDLDHCRYKKHAVVVKKSDFYKTVSYNTLRINNRGKSALNGYQRVAVISDRNVKHFMKLNQSYISKGRPEKHKITLPVRGTMKQFKPRDAMLTGKIMPVNRKRVDTGNTAKPLRKPLIKKPRTSDALVALRDKDKGSGLPFLGTPKLTKPDPNVQHSRTKIREKPQPEAIVPNRIIQPHRAQPNIKQQRATIISAPVFRSQRALPQTDTRRSTGVVKIQPQLSRSKLQSGGHSLHPPSQVMGSGMQMKNYRSNSFSRVKGK